MSIEKELASLKIELAETQMKLLEAQAMLINQSKAKAAAELQKIIDSEKETVECPQPSQ